MTIKKIFLVALIALILIIHISGCAKRRMCYVKIDDPLMQVNEDQDIDLNRIEDAGTAAGTSAGGCAT